MQQPKQPKVSRGGPGARPKARPQGGERWGTVEDLLGAGLDWVPPPRCPWPGPGSPKDAQGPLQGIGPNSLRGVWGGMQRLRLCILIKNNHPDRSNKPRGRFQGVGFRQATRGRQGNGSGGEGVAKTTQGWGERDGDSLHSREGACSVVSEPRCALH